MSFLYFIPIIIIFLLFVFLILVWLRKVQYDAIYRNFLSIKDEFGGMVVRKNLLYRPHYAGEIDDREIRVGFTSEKYKNIRAYYIHFTLSCSSKIQASIIEKNWYESRDELSQNEMISLLDGKYWLQIKKEKAVKFKAGIEQILKDIPDFAYILVADTGLILERVSENLVNDAEMDLNNNTIRALLKFAAFFEK